jgi:hypothetical protein
MRLKISNSPTLGKSEESDLAFQGRQMECDQELAFSAFAFSCLDESIQKLRYPEKYRETLNCRGRRMVGIIG